MVAKVTSLTPTQGPSWSISSFCKGCHRFRRRVTIGIAFAPHRADSADTQPLGIADRRVLDAPIGMMDKLVADIGAG